MLTKVYSATLIGFEAKVIEIEVDIARGERKINIVGLPDKAVKEAKDRILSAFRNCEIDLGPGTKVVNLAPADLPKTGPSYDLPMAIALLHACKHIPKFEFAHKLFLGELALDGSLRGVKGVLPILSSARKQGFTEVYLPSVNQEEALLVKGCNILPFDNLRQIIQNIRTGVMPLKASPSTLLCEQDSSDYSFVNIKGQIRAKRALQIAAAGGHNVLMSGVPGSGKTYLARAFPTILPRMTFDECIEVTRIYSVAGEIDVGRPLMVQRPFRSPHHSASRASVIGGGINPRPGEVSLAHHGVLFLDELPEFESDVLESLRQPLEDKFVTVTRVNGRITFPANFQLIASMNPCRCGYFGSDEKACHCTKYERDKYIQRLSGPLLDRFDLFVNVQKVQFEDLTLIDEQLVKRQYEDMVNRIASARAMQLKRFRAFAKANTRLYSNSDLSASMVAKMVPIDGESQNLLGEAVNRFNLSARGYYKVLKLARTIADLACCDNVLPTHIAEALNFRMTCTGE